MLKKYKVVIALLSAYMSACLPAYLSACLPTIPIVYLNGLWRFNTKS